MLTALTQAVVLGLLIGSTYALAGAGLSLIYGVMQVINFAHGALLILAAFLTYSVWDRTGLDPLVALVVTTPLMFGLGWLLYATVIRPVRADYVGAAILLPFGLGLLIEAGMGFAWGNNARSIRPAYADESFHLGPLFVPFVQAVGLVLALVLLTALVAFLRRTWTGRAIRASAANPQGAALVGINVGAIASVAFATGVAATAAGGSIIGVLYPFVPGSGTAWLARLLAIVVLGGMGNLAGTVLAGLALGVAESLTSHYIGVDWTTSVPYLAVFAVLLLRPQGLLGTRLRQDVP
ncbi:branched-chain amino acid ABC transporter permease [Pseudonocardia acaciae]|uniref:branched-chain amino acid ABC transporter permease n=1 Tax=Pseudonocardia acaciae TaxID=551276 RepID=UPI000A9BDB15|nr:branched-chain amino acid ABC transporter permease [Pseudonocardia acaciae]